MTQQDPASVIKSPVVKSATAIAAAGGANTTAAVDAKVQLAQHAQAFPYPESLNILLALPWGHIASMCAAMYTTALLLEWLWKKPIRWVLVSMRLRKADRVVTDEEWEILKRSAGR